MLSRFLENIVRNRAKPDVLDLDAGLLSGLTHRTALEGFTELEVTTGCRPRLRAVHVHDVHATILHLLGLDHERVTYYHNGRDQRLTDVAGNVVEKVFT